MNFLQFNVGCCRLIFPAPGSPAQELQTAIEQPANSLKVQLEPGLTQRLIDVVLESSSYLPLQEFTLTQLWQKQHRGWLRDNL
ncbi:hypothetical protein G7B40_015295 [Aetokthonos hydrillicola Thurmond2011]|jgi:hypothetical protein|uniref:Novel STAND NTPase 1 domain-containing protein n=1 Tax=Aetokthonos hydrillicola Thurmond2011 TaxID=2712845 RepID=A0AAP5I9Y6_9CYAN|nr:hypothetical protein [Aetokthonos hydrillicola]MBO3461639.1 hypothetical protein [Aetokthonos hydrillicola CCALA 1050]MBW4588748.1 hypothetical protein [Aetokthonos hydrillicola CCALA 1050]MDR9895918.1 hypothetical protein [Aetokthonos hydrillicola Thurmond2011]